MPLISTLPKRVNPVTIADFKAADGLIYPLETVEVDQSTVDYWNNWIDYTPPQIAGLFSDQIRDGFQLQIISSELGKFIFSLKHDLYGTQEQRYNFNYNLVEYTDARMDEAIQGRRHGRDITMRFIDLDIALGVRRVLFSAELAVGGYAWARMGYELDKGDAIKIAEVGFLSKTLLSKLAALENVIPKNSFNHAKVYARCSNTDDLYHLTQIGDDLSGYINVEDFEDSGFLLQSLRAVFFDEDSALRAADRMKKVTKFCLDKGRPLTIGKLLLIGESWRGRVDYDNDVQMGRILKYGGESAFSQLQRIAQQPQPLAQTRRFAFS